MVAADPWLGLLATGPIREARHGEHGEHDETRAW